MVPLSSRSSGSVPFWKVNLPRPTAKQSLSSIESELPAHLPCHRICTSFVRVVLNARTWRNAPAWSLLFDQRKRSHSQCELVVTCREDAVCRMLTILASLKRFYHQFCRSISVVPEWHWWCNGLLCFPLLNRSLIRIRTRLVHSLT